MNKISEARQPGDDRVEVKIILIRHLIWHLQLQGQIDIKINCKAALNGQPGSSLFSKKAPTHQLSCPLSSKVAKPCQTYMHRLNKPNSVGF